MKLPRVQLAAKDRKCTAVHKCKRLWHVQDRQPANQRACTFAQSATWIDTKRRLVATTHPSRYLQRTHCQSCDRVYICLQCWNRTRGEPPCCLELHVCSQACGDGPARRRFPVAGAYVFVSLGLVVPSLSPAMRISSAMVPRSQTSGAFSSLRGQPWLLTGPPWADVSIDPPRLNAVCRSSSLRVRLYRSSRCRFAHHPPAGQLLQSAKALCSCIRLKLVLQSGESHRRVGRQFRRLAGVRTYACQFASSHGRAGGSHSNS